jgi:hypothetical protein
LNLVVEDDDNTYRKSFSSLLLSLFFLLRILIYSVFQILPCTKEVIYNENVLFSFDTVKFIFLISKVALGNVYYEGINKSSLSPFPSQIPAGFFLKEVPR